MSTQPAADRSAERLLLENIGDVDRLLETIARRHHLDPQHAEDFASWARARLTDDDYAILRKFKGTAKLRTYLAVVLANLFRDYRNREWGRWRPSTQATRLGPVARRMEQLVYRDGLSVREAIATLQHGGCDWSSTDLARLMVRIPIRAREREIPLHDESALAPDEYQPLTTESERRSLAAAIHDVLGRLSDQEQVIVKLRFWEDMSVADIARTLRMDQKPLYRRLDAIQDQLRRALEDRGVTRDIAMDAFAEVEPW